MSKIKSIFYSQKLAPYMFVLPFVATFLVFFLYPLTQTIKMSFQDILPGQVQWVGLSNYETLFQNKTFYKAVSNSLRYTVITCALLIPFPLYVAPIIPSRSLPLGGFS